jgi:AraC-like DNA-binding protein
MNNKTVSDLQAHSDCPLIHKKDEPVFEIIGYRTGTTVSHTINAATIVCVIDGEIKFSNKTAVKNELFVLSAHSNFTVEFTQSGSLLYLYIPSDIEICWRIKQKMFEYSPQTARRNATLQATKTIENCISRFIDATTQNVQCTKLLQSYIGVIVNMICVEYPLDMLADFFSPLRYCDAKNGINFKAIVLQNRNKIFKVSEFAEAVYMSSVSFRRRFERVFGMHPQVWIMKNRQNLIYDELRNGTKSLTQISILAGFKSVREFFAYCKKHFGRTAATIRREDGNQEE